MGTTHMKYTAGLVFGLISSLAWGAPNELTKLGVSSRGDSTEVRVACSQAPVFNVFRLKDPDRLIVDVSNASISAIKGHHEGLGPVTGVVASQFSDTRSEVGRLLFGLEGARKYDVRAEGSTLVVSIDRAAPSAGEAPPVAPQPAASEPPASEPAAAATPSATSETVIASRVDEKVVKVPATRLKAVRATEASVRLVTDGELARFEVIELADPPRLALDLTGLTGAPHAPRVRRGNVKQVRVGAHDGKVRVVLEFAQRATFDVHREPDGLTVRLGQAPVEKAPLVAQSEPEAIVEIDGKPVPAVVEPGDEVAEVTDVKFIESGGGGVVQLALKGAPRWKVERPDDKSAVLNLENAKVARQLERSLDTSALATSIRMVSVFSVPGAAPRVRVVVASAEAFEQSLAARGTLLQWRFSPRGAAEQAVSQSEAAGFSTESATVADEGAPQQRRGYVGKRVSFEFKDIDIHNLLRIIAEISKKNIVVADDVSGKVTVRLRNVPWDQALDLVLRSKGLGKEEFGNIIRVAPLTALESESRSRGERVKNERLAKPLQVALIPVNYATAIDMASRVKDVLTERGSVSVDGRTNTLIVRELPENLGKVRSMVTSLDLQTPQVLIEARIVEANVSFAREVGIQWGGQGLMSAATGNPTGLLFPNTVAVTGGVATGANAGTATAPNYAVSLPVGAADGSGGALGMVFGSAGGAAQLNLRLTAFERTGSVKTISAPKVATLDHISARISQGVDIPFLTTSAAGASVSFVQARLSLEVTPHITQDGSVMMAINAQNNQPDPANLGAGGQPGIQRKEAATSVLVKDGDTTVIGGIYVRVGSSSQNGLPILSKIPVIGFFFRNSKEAENKTELLIFVTPRILNRATVAQNP
jgi:type IV pilus assembly protein PilQ